MNMDNNNNIINSDGHVLDILPEYIDKSLSADQRIAVRAHLESCATCRADYIELQATRFALKQMPVAATPRSFAITEEVAKYVKKPSFLESLFVPRLAPTFAGGSVVAFVLLVFLFATNSSINSTPPSVFSTEAQYNVQAPNSAGSPDQVGVSPSAKEVVPAPIAPDTEDPTAMANASSGTSDTAAAGETPEASTRTLMGAAPESTQAPDTSSGTVTVGSEAMPPSVITPNTTVSDSITSSPTTVGYGDKQPGVTTNDGNTSDTAPPSANSVTPALEIGLLALGVALATAAIIARRRTL